MVVHSTQSAPIVPDDPKGLHQVTVTFTLKNLGKSALRVDRLRTSTSSTITSIPKVPCEIPGEGVLEVTLVAKTFDQPVTRRAWVETQNEQMELQVRVDPAVLRAAVKAAPLVPK